MNENDRYSAPEKARRDTRPIGSAPGGASIVTVFTVLCLTVFAALSLLTARHDLALSKRSADAAAAFYAADAEAAEWVNSLDPTDFTSLERVFALDERRELAVAVTSDAGEVKITSWLVRNAGETVYNDEIPVWDGEIEIIG